MQGLDNRRDCIAKVYELIYEAKYKHPLKRYDLAADAVFDCSFGPFAIPSEHVEATVEEFL